MLVGRMRGHHRHGQPRHAVEVPALRQDYPVTPSIYSDEFWQEAKMSEMVDKVVNSIVPIGIKMSYAI